MAAFERQVLCHAPWSSGFGVVGAGRDARDMCKACDVGMDVGETQGKPWAKLSAKQRGGVSYL